MSSNNPPSIREYAEKNNITATEALEEVLKWMSEEALTKSTETGPTLTKMTESLQRYPEDETQTPIDRGARFLKIVGEYQDALTATMKPIRDRVNSVLDEVLSAPTQQVRELQTIGQKLRQRLTAAILAQTAEHERQKSHTVQTPDARITLIPTPHATITDPQKIPMDYCVPDLPKIRKALANGEDVPGVERRIDHQMRFTPI